MVEFYPRDFNIHFAPKEEALRRALGPRFDDWIELARRLNYVCSLLPNIKEGTARRKNFLDVCSAQMLHFPKNFDWQDFFSLTMKIDDIEPGLAHHIFSMIRQVVMERNLGSRMRIAMKWTPDSRVPILYGANQFFARKNVWKYLEQLSYHLVNCESVPRQKISPLMCSSRKLGFSIFPLEMSVSSGYLREKRCMKLLCLSGIMRILLRNFFRMTSDSNTYQLVKAIKKFLDEKHHRLLK